MRAQWVRIVFQCVGLALFAVILSRVDLAQIWRDYRRVDLISIVGGAALLVTLTFLKSLRWRRIVAAQGIEVPPGMAFRVYAASLYLGVVTPGHVGDFAKSLYLTNRGMSAGKSIFSSFADRLFDIVVLVVVGYVSLLFFPGIFPHQLLVATLLLGVALAAVCVLRWRRDLLTRIVKVFLAVRGSSGVRARLDRGFTDGIGEFALLGRRVVSDASLLTAGAWLCHYFFFILAAGALDLGVPVGLVVVSVSVAIFVALIPVSVSGLGTRDLVLILMFARLGFSKETAVAFSFSFIVVYLVQGLIGLVCWLTVPLERREVA